MSEQINIDAIMDEIRAEAEKNGSCEQLPDFNDQPIMEPRVRNGPWSASIPRRATR